jgi:hypothetical protein
MKRIDRVIEIVIRESLEWRMPGGRNGTGRRQTTFTRFGGVKDHAAASALDVVEQGPLRGEQRAADQSEGNALAFEFHVFRKRCGDDPFAKKSGEGFRRGSRGILLDEVAERGASVFLIAHHRQEILGVGIGWFQRGQELAEPDALGVVEFSGCRRLPCGRQVEQKDPRGRLGDGGVGCAAHLVAGGGKDQGVAGV